MDTAMLEQRLENIDHRLARLEQILPTLATRDELKTLATKKDLVALATKEDLTALATKEELTTLATKGELRAEHDRLRLDMKILIEHQDSKLDLLAEHVLSLKPKPTEE